MMVKNKFFSAKRSVNFSHPLIAAQFKIIAVVRGILFCVKGCNKSCSACHKDDNKKYGDCHLLPSISSLSAPHVVLFYLEFYKSLEFKTQEIEGDSGKTSPRRDLNPRPTAYEAVALPLSYKGKLSIIFCLSLLNFFWHSKQTICFLPSFLIYVPLILPKKSVSIFFLHVSQFIRIM